MPACMCHFECCCLFAWGIFSWHVSCAVKAYCVWVITCHRKPWALLTPPITPLLLLFHRSPTVFLSNPCQPCFSPFCLSSLSLSHFLLLFQSVSCQKGDSRVLRLVGSLICLFYLFIYFFSFYFSWRHSTMKQPMYVPMKFLPGLAAAPICKTCNNRVQRLCWWWQVHWQSPSAWAVHITALQPGAFMFVWAIRGVLCTVWDDDALYWIVQFYFQYIFFLFDLFFFFVFFSLPRWWCRVDLYSKLCTV